MAKKKKNLLPLLPLADVIAREDALFVVSHSGGKDSQAMCIEVLKQVPAHRVIVVHCALGDMEWPGAREWAENQANAAGVPFIVAHAFTRKGDANHILDYAERRYAQDPNRPPFPSKNTRYCTSEFKRGPADREAGRYARKHGFKVVVMCDGRRAQEGKDRAKLCPWTIDERNDGSAERRHFDWLPVHAWHVKQVWATVRDAGQQLHPQYAAGNERLSCIYCFQGSENDLRNGYRAGHVELANRIMAMEDRMGFTMHINRKPLREILGLAA